MAKYIIGQIINSLVAWAVFFGSLHSSTPQEAIAFSGGIITFLILKQCD